MACAAPDAVQRARELARLFHEDLDAFARFAPAAPEELPAGPRQLLDHPSHMTVAMERFHGGPVGLVVASSRLGDDGRYAREILLTTPAGRIVQHGVVRIDLARLPAATAEAIRRETTPLGRILLAAGLLCEVHDVSLLRIAVGRELAALCDTAVPAETFGRVATITLDGRPAIELLEIVASGSAELT